MRKGAVLLALAALIAMLMPAAALARGHRPHINPRTGVRPGASVRDPIGTDPMLPGKPYSGDFPDPTILGWSGHWYAYATSTGNRNVPVLTSSHLTQWWVPKARPSGSTDALPDVARWAAYSMRNGHRMAITWAPSVARIAGRFVLAYAVRKRGTKRMCISTATSARPAGPFVDRSLRPLVCDPHGDIDPMYYRTGGREYLVFKTDDNAYGDRARMWIQQLRAGGRRFAANSHRHLLLLAKPRSSWENTVVENPSMIVVKGRRYVFYTGNGWASPKYGIAYAQCAVLTGPCARGTEYRSGKRVMVGPILQTDSHVAAPGGDFTFRDGSGRLLMAYAAWAPGHIGYATSNKCRSTTAGCPQRRMHIARLAVNKNGVVSVADEDIASGQ